MFELLNETLFEKHMAEYLAGSRMYNQRTPKDFNIQKLVDSDMLLQFLREQPMWQKLITQSFADEQDALNIVIETINTKINRGESLLSLLKNGFMLQGRRIRLAAFKPEMTLDDDADHLYQKNIFSVVRQMKYSTLGFDKENELDLCILLNGLPIITLELKNEATGQTVVNAMHQYQTNRHPQNRMLRTCLVHFAMDNNRVMMTTKLAGNNTQFLPFNKETVNPQVEGDYPTCYMWKEVLQADSLLNLIQHFIKRITPKKGEPFYIFPRYHQLRCVRNIISDVREKGVGQTYLVQHSAGSGKTKSMSWLAFQLANLQNADNTPVFDSVIMITDRIVLDRNIADEIKGMEEVAGTVKDIRKGSRNLAKALAEGGHRIIISTEQKFSFALPKLKEAAGSHFAVIIDEAHTAFGKQASHDVRQVLTNKSELRETVEEFGIESREAENNMQDQMLAELQAARSINSGHISYFAFTATPKSQTFALYGRNGKAFDTYSMKQAIEEGFILDVLKNYTTFQTMFELVSKVDLPEDTPEYEKQNALRLMMQYVNQHPYVINYKANMMVDYFMQHSAQKMKGQAKAIVVTSSRANAILFHQAITRRLKEKYNGEVKALVAFSGEVEINGNKYTEEKINGFGIKDNGIAVEFKQPNQRFLVVADKFQTGFDQPLLHTMFVDRKLGGVQCIQTLSRLNRCHPDKQDTLIIDFVNKHEDIKTAFEDYYDATWLQGNYNPSNIYEYKNDIERRKLFTQSDVDKVVTLLLCGDEQQIVGIPSILGQLVNEYVKPLPEEEQELIRKEVNRYIRQYGLLAQLMKFLDPDLERFYMFCKLYYKYLPYTKETLPLDILEKIDLDKYRIQLAEQGCITLEGEGGKLTPPSTASISGGEKEFDNLDHLIHMINEPYEGFLNENDQIILELLRQLRNDPNVKQAFSAENSHSSLLKMVEKEFNKKVATQLGKYINLKKLLNSNQAFNEEFLNMLVTFLGQSFHTGKVLEYNEELLKDVMFEKLEDTFSELCGHGYRELEEVLDCLFAILKTHTVKNLDGLNTMIPNQLNKFYRGENEPVDLKVIFGALLPKYEAFLRKLYYLKEGELFVSTKGDGWVAIVKTFHEIDNLYYNHGKNPKLNTFETYYKCISKWRNENVHLAPELPDAEVAPAIHMVVSMYIYAVMVSITDLEMAGCELDNSGVTAPDVCPSTPIIPYKMTTMADLGRDDSKDQKVADHPIDKMNEAEKMDLLKRSILKAQSYTPLFTKKRHWISIYKMAAHKNIIIDGDYAHFVQRIGMMDLKNMPSGLSENYLSRMNKGVFADDPSEWTSIGLSGIKLSEFTDIKETAEKFGKIIDEINYKE